LKGRCFDPFPFPRIGDEVHRRLSALGEQLDAHRRRQQDQHPDLTMTAMYNVLDKLRNGEVLGKKEHTIHEKGLVSVLKQIHDDIDLAVIEAYEWSDLIPLIRVANGNIVSGTEAALTREAAVAKLDELILERLLVLNRLHVSEEQRGIVRWLRPEFQGQSVEPVKQAEIDMAVQTAELEVGVGVDKSRWPKDLSEQARVIHAALAMAGAPVSPRELAARFKGVRLQRLEQLLETLVTLGRARAVGENRFAIAG
jgi:hypothetical protein